MLPCYVNSLYPTLHISKTEICIQPTNRIIMWAKQENTHETQPVPEPITMGKRTVLVMFWEYFMAYMFLVAQLCPTLWKKQKPFGLHPARLLCPCGFSGKNTKVGCISFSRGSSQPKDQTHISCVSCIAGRSFPAELLGKLLKYGKCVLILFLCIDERSK